MSVTRDILFQEIWKEPMTKVAKRYAVSSNYLARICECLDVPRPCRGYWAKLAHGKAPPQPTLPEAQPGAETEWIRGTEPKRRPPPLPTIDSLESAMPAAPVTRCRGRHPLVAKAESLYENVRETRNGYLKPRTRHAIDVFVSRETLPRALRLANRLYMAFENAGHKVGIGLSERYSGGRPALDEREKGRGDREYSDDWRPWGPTLVFFGTLAVGLTIYETSAVTRALRVDGKYRKLGYVPPDGKAGYSYETDNEMPTGRLCLRAFLPYRMAAWTKVWRDMKQSAWPEVIPSIVAELKHESPHLVKVVEEGERQAQELEAKWKAEQLEHQRREAIRQRKEATEASRKQLFEAIEQWGLAKRIEGFFEDAEKRAALLGESDRPAILERLKLARELIGEADALGQLRSWPSPEECLQAIKNRRWY